MTVAGRAVFAENVDQAFVPASTMKLATAAATLARIDTTDRLVTRVVAGARPSPDGVVQGDLWMVGGGDPVLATSAWMARFHGPQTSTSLDALADAVVAGGVRVIEGRVLGDDSRYDRVRQVPSWSQHVVESNEAGPLSALTVNDGFRAWKGDHGTPFADPPTGAASALAELLAQRGVHIGGAAGAGSAPASGQVIARQESPPVGEIVSAMLRQSDNGTAELLTKELGVRGLGEGSTAAGVRVVSQALRELGLPMDGVRVADGSGLDTSNRATCRFFVALLTALPGAGPVQSGLPVAGRSGTLERRFVGSSVAGRLRAKTGSLEGVATLAGFVDAPVRGATVFAYMVNGLQRDADGRRLSDALAVSLVDASLRGP